MPVGLRWRPQYEDFVCRRCQMVDELKCLRSGLPSDYRGRNSGADAYEKAERMMVWSRRFASLLRRLAGEHLEFFELPGDRRYVVPWPKRTIEPPADAMPRRRVDWRKYPHPFQVSSAPCKGCGRRRYTFCREHLEVPADVVIAAVPVNSGGQVRLWTWIVSERLAEHIRRRDFRGVVLERDFKEPPEEMNDDTPRDSGQRRRAKPKASGGKGKGRAARPKRRRPPRVTVDRDNPFGRLTAERLAAFEKRVGARLPPDYRSFLLKHNGGLPRPASWTEAAADVMDYPVRLFPLHDRRYNDDTPEGGLGFSLQAAWKDLRSEMPDTSLLAVGADWGGNYYCVELRGPDRGRVFLVDHETGSASDEAESFADFLERLDD